jgi:hypothetical protein
MKRARILMLAAVLAAAASGTQAADPHWTAAIGTGRASESSKPAVRSVRAVSVPTTDRAVTSQPHWTARIGTGDASRAEEKRLTFGQLEAVRACSCPAP